MMATPAQASGHWRKLLQKDQDQLIKAGEAGSTAEP